MIRQTLQSLGLNEKEIDLYLALLGAGSAPASVLARRTGISRSTAQYTCQQLKKRGLIGSVQKGNSFLYTAKSPQELISFLNRQKEELERKHTDVQKVMGELLSLVNDKAVIPKVRFFEGVGGMIEMLDDVLKDSKPINAMFKLEEKEDIDPVLWDYFETKYIPERKKLKNSAMSLFNDNQATREYRDNDADMNRITLLLPTEEFPFEACCHIYGNKVAFYSYQSKDLTGVIVEDELIAKTQFAVFKAAWNYARTLELNKQYKNYELN